MMYRVSLICMHDVFSQSHPQHIKGQILFFVWSLA